MTVAGPWLRPDWPAPPQVHALCTTRGIGVADGASAAPCEFFNLGDHVGDAPAAVAANRARLRDAVGARPVFMNQVHGVQVVQLTADSADGVAADAAVCNQPGLACTVMVADCLPVLLTNRAGTAVAAVHAGWRGLAAGVIEQALARFRLTAIDGAVPDAIKPEANEVIAWLGPCIGPGAFEVGAEVRQALTEADPGATACFQSLSDVKYLADLPALARRRLAAQGVASGWGNDGSDRWCTVSQRQRFFSHRRDRVMRGSSGRMAACIWLV